MNLYFEYSAAQDLVSGFSLQVLEDLFLYNVEDCTFWSFDSFSDYANGALLLMEENNAGEAFLSFEYGFHKLPVAWFKCAYSLDDYDVLTNLTTELSKGFDDFGDIVTTFFWNLFFNWVDIMYEVMALSKAYDQRDWYLIGTFVAKIFADVVFKNPENISWNYKNSDVITAEWGVAPSFWRGVDELFRYWGFGEVLSEEERENETLPDSAGDIFNFEEDEEIIDTTPDVIIDIGDDEDGGGGQTISVGAKVPTFDVAHTEDVFRMKDRSANLKSLAACVNEHTDNGRLVGLARAISDHVKAGRLQKADRGLETALLELC